MDESLKYVYTFGRGGNGGGAGAHSRNGSTGGASDGEGEIERGVAVRGGELSTREPTRSGDAVDAGGGLETGRPSGTSAVGGISEVVEGETLSGTRGSGL